MMIGDVVGLIGYFPGPDALRNGIETAVRSHAVDPVAYTPIPDASAFDTLRPSSSPVRWVALAGGLFGIAAALSMTIWMSWDYPVIVGGKPITSIPPFMVAAFELMVLFGSIGSIAGFLWFSRLPDLTPSQAYRPELAVDQYAIFLPLGSESERGRVERILQDAGATEIAPVLRSERGRLEVLD
ncbi:MAG TPA: DUF3341 domain-containing protein [Armatimonadota bacterium]|jgi:hypothetical protein